MDFHVWSDSSIDIVLNNGDRWRGVAGQLGDVCYQLQPNTTHSLDHHVYGPKGSPLPPWSLTPYLGWGSKVPFGERKSASTDVAESSKVNGLRIQVGRLKIRFLGPPYEVMSQGAHWRWKNPPLWPRRCSSRFLGPIGILSGWGRPWGACKCLGLRRAWKRKRQSPTEVHLCNSWALEFDLGISDLDAEYHE